MADLPSAPFLHPLTVRRSDIDELDHVNNAVYLTWVQSAVLGHWHALASPEAVAEFRWIAVKHEITFRKPAFVGDQIIATAVLERVQRESAFYDVKISRGTDLLADAKSRWCCIEADTLRPARLPENVIAAFKV